ncbi:MULTISPECIES: ERF family protein [Enterococcus]|mgnify:FL=1|uniref:ERF family protein n=1 Tax=Enterococcus TaxID=1350 RepID=UPI001C0FB438|nr:ERF family protein [Enterococcus gallinarum]MBU5357068.1 ERF family protein [Enterococcus gallinarum]
MSDKERTFLERVSLLITELKAPKSQRNNFGKYNYRSAEDILEAVKPLAYKYGLVAKLSDEPVMIGDWHYIKATASIKDVKTGEEEIATAYAREPLAKKGMDESQITGTASSYARKYAMNGLYQIDDTKDADTDEYTEQVKWLFRTARLESDCT